MGKTKYSDHEREKIISAFISAAREIIETSGLDGLSIRRVAALTGYSSATIYIYFPNVDVLVTMACISYLESYCRAIAADMDKMRSSYDAHMHTWELFCRFAFDRPQIFYHLFYVPHTVELEETLRDYYKLYPRQLEDIEGPVREMLLGGCLEDRCMKVLWPLAQERGISREDCEMINDISICYFRKLLEMRCNNSPQGRDKEVLMAKMSKCLVFLVECHPQNGCN